MRALPLTFLARQFGAWSVIALGAVTGKVLGPAARGVVETLVVLRLGMHAVSTLGVPTAATYAIAKDPTLFRPAARTALALGLALGLATSLVLAVAVLLAPGWLAPIPPAFALLFAASAPAILANQIEGGVLLGGGRVGAWNALTIVNRGTMIASLGLLAIPPLRAIETVVAGLVVAETATLVYVVRTLARAGAGGVALDRPLVRSLRRYGLSSWLHGMLVFAMLRVDNLLLGAMAGPGELGQYAAAGVAREMILFLPWVAGMLFLPKVAGSVGPGASSPSDGAAGPRPAAPRALSPAGWAVVYGACALLFVFAGPFVLWLYDGRFLPAIPIVRILVPAALLAGIGNLFLQELLGRGAPRAVVLAPALALVVSLAGNLVFIPRAGALGTAWVALASAAVNFTVSGAAVFAARREAATDLTSPSPAP